MSYECNPIINYMLKNSILIQCSKSSKSVYFYFRLVSFRYSDHRTSHTRHNQIQIIRKAHGVKILFPGDKEYTECSEKYGFYLIRRYLRGLEKASKRCCDGGRVSMGYRKWKIRVQESREIKRCLKGLSGVSKEGLKNYRLKTPDSLIYVEEKDTST